ncbi:MAG: hypothetical protein HQK59_08025 [Deltaproteobacteria bacterium]|nr:hypothetical protein [Deltaproteobacteria bacterium]
MFFGERSYFIGDTYMLLEQKLKKPFPDTMPGGWDISYIRYVGIEKATGRPV